MCAERVRVRPLRGGADGGVVRQGVAPRVHAAHRHRRLLLQTAAAGQARALLGSDRSAPRYLLPM